jgi:hypothetical protein
MNVGAYGGSVIGRRSHRWQTRYYAGDQSMLGYIYDEGTTTWVPHPVVPKGNQHVVDVPSHISAVRVTGTSGSGYSGGCGCWNVIIPLNGSKLVVAFEPNGATSILAINRAIWRDGYTTSNLSIPGIEYALWLTPENARLSVKGRVVQTQLSYESSFVSLPAQPCLNGLLLGSTNRSGANPAFPPGFGTSASSVEISGAAITDSETAVRYTPGAGSSIVEGPVNYPLSGFVKIEWLG